MRPCLHFYKRGEENTFLSGVEDRLPSMGLPGDGCSQHCTSAGLEYHILCPCVALLLGRHVWARCSQVRPTGRLGRDIPLGLAREKTKFAPSQTDRNFHLLFHLIFFQFSIVYLVQSHSLMKWLLGVTLSPSEELTRQIRLHGQEKNCFWKKK